MVGSKLIVYGGSDGDDCFRDVWVFDVETAVWRRVDFAQTQQNTSNRPPGSAESSGNGSRGNGRDGWDGRQGGFRRLSHSATVIGSYLFVVGGHDGDQYENEVLLLNLGESWSERGRCGSGLEGRLE